MSEQMPQKQIAPSHGAVTTAIMGGFSFFLSIFFPISIARVAFFFIALLLGALFIYLYWKPLIRRERDSKEYDTHRKDLWAMPTAPSEEKPLEEQAQKEPIQHTQTEPAKPIEEITPLPSTSPSETEVDDSDAYNNTTLNSKYSIYSNDEGLTYTQIQRKKDLIRWLQKDLISQKEFQTEMDKLLRSKKR